MEIVKKIIKKFHTPQNSGTAKYPLILNIETSYMCNLHCIMCPRSFKPESQGLISMSIIEKIEPELKNFEIVHLSGFGEPLMNKKLPSITAKISKYGCKVCITTNGVLLNERISRELVEAGLALPNISIDAGTKETYEKIRGRGYFDILMNNLDLFFKIVRESKRKIYSQWCFVMMKNNICELPQAVRLAAKLGFNTIVAKHIETAVSKESLCDALFDTKFVPPPDEKTIESFNIIIDESKKNCSGRRDYYYCPSASVSCE